MDEFPVTENRGTFDARYLAFLETISQLRPSLHRYCSRMTGSVMDGEDLAQEAVFQAYRKLETYDESRPLAPWLFRIAHNRCVDFLRRREVREEAEAAAAGPGFVEPEEPAGPVLGRAVEHLVLALPPMERACVLLKDVFDYSLDEVAELVDSTVGGVKAALHRGRGKLAALPQASAPKERAVSPELEQLLSLYVERFNRRDWDGVRQLITADARLLVADRFSGPLANAPYFQRYSAFSHPWRMAVGVVDGELAVIGLGLREDAWTPVSVIRVEAQGDRIQRVTDFMHCPWTIALAQTVAVGIE